jgi:WD40 repeat protein
MQRRRLSKNFLNRFHGYSEGVGRSWSLRVLLGASLLTVSVAISNAGGQTVLDLQRSVTTNEWLRSVAWSPDGTTLVATGGLAHVRVWKANNLSEVPGFTELRQGSAGLAQHSIAFSADGRLLAAGNLVAQVWNAATGQLKLSLVAPFIDLNRLQPIGIMSLTFSPDQSLLLVAYSTPLTPALKNPVIAYRVSDGTIVWRFEQQPTVGLPHIDTPLVPITGRNEVAFGTGEGNPQFDRLARVIVLNADTGVLVRSIDHVHVEEPSTIALSTDERWFATSTNTGDVQHAFDLKDNKVVDIDNRDPIRIWDVVSGKLVRELPVKARSWSLAFSPDGRYLIGTETSLASGSKLLVWSLESGAVIQTLPFPRDLSAPFGLAFSPDGRSLAAACGNGVAVFKYRGGQ